MTQKNSPTQMDVRVRERNLKSGALTEKDVEKHLATLPDLADQTESFATHQPALAQPAVVESDLDDEDEDEEGEAPEAT